MSSRYAAILCALLLILGLFTSCQDEPTPSVPIDEHEVAIVYETDSTEWRVLLIAQHLLYANAVQVEVPAPYALPTREDATILKTCNYPHDERFVTSDGYTFGMPSTSVSKAGHKTKYSVLGLWKRPTTISVQFSRSR